MLTKVSINNFKAHGHTEIELEPLTVLVGANGVGKTSVLEALNLLGGSFVRLSEPLPVEHISRLLPLLRSKDQTADITANFTRDDGTDDSLQLKFEHNKDQLDFSLPTDVDPNDISALGFKNRTKRQEELNRHVGSTVLMKLDARAIASTGYVDADGPGVGPDGSNVAAVLATWKLDDDQRFADTLSGLKEIVHQVRNIRIRPVPPVGNKPNGYAMAFDFDDASNVPAAMVSEGTLVTLAILTLLHSARQPRLLLLDDLGSELHPTAQGELVRLLRKIQSVNPELQIIATTHSPYILDGVEPKNVRVFARAKDGTAQVRSLAEHPESARTDLTTGQLWTLDPEQWVLDEAQQ